MFKGKNYINGQWETTQESYSKINPATGDVLGIFPETKEEDVKKAVSVARETFEKWRKVSRFVRSDYMNKVAQIIERRREELAKVISLETVIGVSYRQRPR